MRFAVFAVGAAAMMATTESRSLSDGVAQFEDEFAYYAELADLADLAEPKDLNADFDDEGEDFGFNLAPTLKAICTEFDQFAPHPLSLLAQYNTEADKGNYLEMIKKAAEISSFVTKDKNPVKKMMSMAGLFNLVDPKNIAGCEQAAKDFGMLISFIR